MRHKATGVYPENWPELSRQVKEEAGWNCERCGHGHWPGGGYALTTHHLDGDKSNCARWNLAALCQRCHLRIQGRVFLPQFYMFEFSDWFVPHVVGYYNSLGLKVVVTTGEGLSAVTVANLEGEHQEL